MNARMMAFGLLILPVLGLPAYAGQADSSASAASNGWGPGTAAATAGYDGNGIGFARTDTRSGNTNFAQGVSFGVDEEGLSLSTSYAVAPRLGPAAAGTLNLAIGYDGSVAHSVGRTVADGSPDRAVSAGGQARPGYRGQPATAGATVHGLTGPTGTVVSNTHSQSHRPRTYAPPVQKRVVRRTVRRVVRLR